MDNVAISKKDEKLLWLLPKLLKRFRVDGTTVGARESDLSRE